MEEIDKVALEILKAIVQSGEPEDVKHNAITAYNQAEAFIAEGTRQWHRRSAQRMEMLKPHDNHKPRRAKVR